MCAFAHLGHTAVPAGPPAAEHSALQQTGPLTGGESHTAGINVVNTSVNLSALLHTVNSTITRSISSYRDCTHSLKPSSAL